VLCKNLTGNYWKKIGNMIDFQEITFKFQDRLAIITLNNPDSLNPFSIQMGREITQAVDECEYRNSIRSIIITGNGRAFCAGGDIKAMADYPEEQKAIFFKKITSELNNVIKAIRHIKKPVIAAVNGVASGAGFSLALACDLIIASAEARFNLAHVKLGLHPDGGATYFLPRLIGIHKTFELVFTGSFLDAFTAERLGIVNRIVAPEKVMDDAMALANELANGPPFAIGITKMTINQGLSESLEAQLENERQAIAQTSMTDDFIEGIAAFLEKRNPVFKGK
jgi:2-(1,2-epoxy-1,2-dihydrophenyl)acetyl-CoA isomerase